MVMVALGVWWSGHLQVAQLFLLPTVATLSILGAFRAMPRPFDKHACILLEIRTAAGGSFEFS